jgi:hypothetical protein
LPLIRLDGLLQVYCEGLGWSGLCFNVGDVVTIDAFPAKDGSKRLGFPKAIHFADGHLIVWGTADSEDK